MNGKRCVGFALFVTLLGLCAAPPAGAASFTVTLKNDTTFECRYPPKSASWDPSVVLLLNDVGNWVAIPESEVASVSSEAEEKGYGRVIDTTTLDMGVLPNDLPTEQGGMAGQSQQLTPFEQVFNRSYDLEQFVEPSETGRGGLPVYGIGVR